MVIDRSMVILNSQNNFENPQNFLNNIPVNLLQVHYFQLQMIN